MAQKGNSMTDKEMNTEDKLSNQLKNPLDIIIIQDIKWILENEETPAHMYERTYANLVWHFQVQEQFYLTKGNIQEEIETKIKQAGQKALPNMKGLLQNVNWEQEHKKTLKLIEELGKTHF